VTPRHFLAGVAATLGVLVYIVGDLAIISATHLRARQRREPFTMRD
jgi:predicted kinase